jgi:hypothetical protein
MALEQNQQKNLIDTTDCLEAISVFRGWKNFLFIIVILCLLLLQVSFWLVDTGCIAAEQAVYNKASAAPVSILEQTAETKKSKENIKKAAEEVVAAPNMPTETAPQQLQSKLANFRFKVEFKHLAWFISFVNFVLVFAAILYCLTMLFSIKVSLLGRLGGINHICRAFFLSLVFLILLLPWQIFWRKFFAGELFGAMYTPGDLLCSFTALKDSGIIYKIFYYFRFTGYWLIALLVLIFSHIRSSRWAKATLRRLEVI